MLTNPSKNEINYKFKMNKRCKTSKNIYPPPQEPSALIVGEAKLPLPSAGGASEK